MRHEEVVMRETVTVIVLWLLCAAGSGVGGAEISTASEPALVIIDIQSFYFEKGLLPLVGSVEASLRAKAVLETFRARGLPVIHIRHESKKAEEEGKANDPQYAIHPNVAPVAGEKVVTKNFSNSFRETDLLPYLREKQIHTLVMCGMQTHMCLEAAARAAADYGFEVTVVHDACATRTLKFGDREVPADMVHAATLATLDSTYARIVSADQLIAEMR